MSKSPPARTPRRPRRATIAELHAQRALVERQRQVLPLVRQQAERWATTAAGIFSAAGLAALIAGPGQFAELADPYAYLTKAAFVLGAAGGVVALVSASVAAQVKLARGLLSVAAQQKYDDEATTSACRWLATARWATAVAVALVLLSAAILWIAPRDDGLLLRGTTRAGELVCGTLGHLGSTAVLEASQERRYPLAALRDVQAADVC